MKLINAIDWQLTFCYVWGKHKVLLMMQLLEEIETCKFLTFLKFPEDERNLNNSNAFLKIKFT